MPRKLHDNDRRVHESRPMHHPYDQCFKSVMNRRLERKARVALERAVHVPPQRIDVAYEPLAPELGLELGRMMALGPGMLEYFAQCPSPDGVEECLRKRLNYAHERLLAAQGNGDAVPPRPWLWILSAGQPREALKACGAEPLVGLAGGILAVASGRVDAPRGAVRAAGEPGYAAAARVRARTHAGARHGRAERSFRR